MSLTLWKLDREQRDRLEDLLEAEETLSAVEYAKESTAHDIEEAREAVEEAKDALAEVSDLVGTKLGNYAKYIQNLDNLRKGVEFKIKEFTRRKNAIARTIDWLKGTLTIYLSTHNRQHIEVDEFKIAKQKGAPAVVVEIPVEELPAEFQRITIEADKNAIREYLQAKPKPGEGKIHPKGVRLVQREHIRIRIK